MTDRGRPLEFGFFLVPNAADPLLDTAREVDRLGLDLIGVQDHPYQRRYVDTWTLLSMIAASTTNVRVFPDVISLPMRPPAVLAKSVASLDALSGGRVELGLGAGAFWDAIHAYGGERRTPGQALRALDEAIQVIRLLWSDGRGLRFAGEHYHLDGAQPGPIPQRRIEIWLGVSGPKALALTGRSADGWLVSTFSVPPEKLPERNELIDVAATEAGRDPASIRRMYNVFGKITDGSSAGFLDGPVDQWADELTELVVDKGMDTFILAGEAGDQLRRFAGEVVPAVREQVAKMR